MEQKSFIDLNFLVSAEAEDTYQQYIQLLLQFPETDRKHLNDLVLAVISKLESSSDFQDYVRYDLVVEVKEHHWPKSKPHVLDADTARYNAKLEWLEKKLEDFNKIKEKISDDSFTRSENVDQIVDEIYLRISKHLEPLKNINIQKNEFYMLVNSAPRQTKTKTDKLKAPVLAFFCYLMNESGINKKDQNESVESYCKRVCKQHKLPYTDRVRQNFNGSDVSKNRKEIERIFALLDFNTRNKIQKYLDNRQPPK